MRDGVHETPTVCGTPGTPHDMDIDTDGEVDTSSSLHNRAPSTQRVINEIKMLDDIQTPIRHSPIFDEGNKDRDADVGLVREKQQSNNGLDQSNINKIRAQQHKHA